MITDTITDILLEVQGSNIVNYSFTSATFDSSPMLAIEELISKQVKIKHYQ